MLQETGPLGLLVEDLAGLRLDPVQLKHALGNVNALYGMIHFGLPIADPSSLEPHDLSLQTLVHLGYWSWNRLHAAFHKRVILVMPNE